MTKELHQAVTNIVTHAPIFKPFFECELSLKEYASRISNVVPNKVYDARRKLLKTILRNKASALFGSNYALLGGDELPSAMNIVDHHHILNHPLLIGDNVVGNYHRFNFSSGSRSENSAIIAITSGAVPPDNHFNQKGFIFSGKRVPIFENKARQICPYFYPKIAFDFFEKLRKAKRINEFNKEQQEFLAQECERLQGLDFDGCRDYNDQLSVVVKDLWPRLFERSLAARVPDLFYMTGEELVAKSLAKVLLEDNFVSGFLFDERMRHTVLERFRGCPIAWNESSGQGTHFFWRKMPGKSKKLRMYVRGDSLVPDEPGYEHLAVSFDRDQMIELLEEKEIFPSVFTYLTVLCFYFGIKPLVGPGSLIYMNFMNATWAKVLYQFDYVQDVENLNSCKVDALVAALTLFYEVRDNTFSELYAYDLVYSGGVSNEYLEKIFSIKVRDLILPAVPNLYQYVRERYGNAKVNGLNLPSANEIAHNVFAATLKN